MCCVKLHCTFQAYFHSFFYFSVVYLYCCTLRGLGICDVQRVTTGDTGPCGLC